MGTENNVIITPYTNYKNYNNITKNTVQHKDLTKGLNQI